jgi:hypothetical protein
MNETEIKMKDASPELRRKIIKVIAKMVADGRLEYAMKDGEVAVRLTEKTIDKAMEKFK